MSLGFPISVKRTLDLNDPYFSLKEITFNSNSISVESDRFICTNVVNSEGVTEIVVIDLYKNNSLFKKPTKKADGSIMHPKKNVIALKGRIENNVGYNVQIFNLDSKTRILDYNFHQPIVYWKWVSENILGIITNTSVWHCFLDASEQTKKIFDRAGKLADSKVQFVNYAVDSSQKWCLLSGLLESQDSRSVNGCVQLFSVERQLQQLLDGYAASFSSLRVNGQLVSVFSFIEKKASQFKLHVMSLNNSVGQPPLLKLVQSSGSYLLYLKTGIFFLYDATYATNIYSHRISSDKIFVCCPSEKTGGILCSNTKGLVISASVNEDSLIPYLQQSRIIPNATQIISNLITTYHYSGGEEISSQNFEEAFARKDYKTAARIVAVSKDANLRSPETITRFKMALSTPGESSPILTYFSTLLEMTKLTAAETIELVSPVIAQNRFEIVSSWLNEDKIECTEALGNLIEPKNPQLALKVYQKINAHGKIVQTLIESRMYPELLIYSKSNVQSIPTNKLESIILILLQEYKEGAIQLVNHILENNPTILDINQIIKIFMDKHCYQEIIGILSDYLKDNLPQQAALQTILFSLCLQHAPKMAETLFQLKKLTHYDPAVIAPLCEKADLYQRALEHYTSANQIKRIFSLHHSNLFNTEWLLSYFSRLSSDVALECLNELLKSNIKYKQSVVQILMKNHEHYGTAKCVELLESNKCYEGLYYFLGSFIAQNQNPDITLKYIEAAAKVNQYGELERICRDSMYFEPTRVKDFLKQAKLNDPRPLIHVCDRFDYIPELTEYLYRNNLLKFIEVYINKVNPKQTPTVIGVLLDLECPEEFIIECLNNVTPACPIQDLVELIESRNRLRLLQPWLESRVSKGSQDKVIHNTLAKIHIDTSSEPMAFLQNNNFYDSKVVGKYCEDRDPYLALVAYQKSPGLCDQEILELTNKNGLFRVQAKYLVSRQDPQLWKLVLSDQNEFKDQLVNQIINSVLPELTSSQEILITIQAFVDAKLPMELLEILDKVILHNVDFSNNEYLQNLLLSTAIQVNPKCVMNYIDRLYNYDASKIASLAAEEPHCLYEEALAIYTKFNKHEEVMKILLNKLNQLPRAIEYAETTDKSAVWSLLGIEYMNLSDVENAIKTFIKAQNPDYYKEIIEICENSENWGALIDYLKMVRKTLSVKDGLIDNELIYAYAILGRLTELNEFLASPHSGHIQYIGERLMKKESYTAAKVLFLSLPNYSKVVTCHLNLKEYQQAIEVAKKANNPKTWKDICLMCLDADMMNFAQTAGAYLVNHTDHLEDVIQHYEAKDKVADLITLLESSITKSDVSSLLVYTELGVIYAKYQPESLNNFLQRVLPQKKLNVAKLIRICEQNQLWDEAILLHKTNLDYDSVLTIMIQYTSAYSQSEFLLLAQKTNNKELLYKCIKFIHENSPDQLCKLLISLINRVDYVQVINLLKTDMALLKPYLEQVQVLQPHSSLVNTILIKLYIQHDDFDKLSACVHTFTSFDQIEVAKILHCHANKDYRRLASLLYTRNALFQEALDINIADKDFEDAIETARLSNSSSISERLLRLFAASTELTPYFVALLDTCAQTIQPDVVLELAWKNKLYDAAFPFLINVVRNYNHKLSELEKKVDMLAAKDSVSAQTKSANPIELQTDFEPLMNNFDNLAILPGSETQQDTNLASFGT